MYIAVRTISDTQSFGAAVSKDSAWIVSVKPRHARAATGVEGRGNIHSRPPLRKMVAIRSQNKKQVTPVLWCNLLNLFGAPGVIRTHGLWLRRPTLYPTELRAHKMCLDMLCPCLCQGVPAHGAGQSHEVQAAGLPIKLCRQIIAVHNEMQRMNLAVTCIHHEPFKIRLNNDHFQKMLPNPAIPPATKPTVSIFPIPIIRGQVPPRSASS